jgi:hypothetical protein
MVPRALGKDDNDGRHTDRSGSGGDSDSDDDRDNK